MNQSTHTWIAARAAALLSDLGEAPGLLKILKPCINSAAIGAWIPDLQDSKKGSGDVDNHVLKMKPYDGDQKARFAVPKPDLLKQLGPSRKVHAFLKKDDTLNNPYWNKPYKAEPRPGQHLADRSMALTTTLIDQLIMGDEDVAEAVPGTVAFAKYLDPASRTKKEQVALYFFMLSHFVADSCMPCHADARYLAAYANGLHHELEEHWGKLVGRFFDKDNILKHGINSGVMLDEARKVDRSFGIEFPTAIPEIKAIDVWREIIAVCRASFAVSCIMSPIKEYPFESRKKSPFKTIFNGKEGEQSLKELDRVIMHDAVLNVAMVWKHVWDKF